MERKRMLLDLILFLNIIDITLVVEREAKETRGEKKFEYNEN